VDKEASQISEWATITHTQFYRDVELYARYWTSVLSADGITPGSIIGLWSVLRPVPPTGFRTLTPHLIEGLVA